jgi:hypothetical protein
MSRKREYIITLKDSNDLESFYKDMESRGGTGFVPNRAVSVKERRPMSRNTHYMLFDSEAERIKQDARVLNIELTFEEQGIKISPLWTQTSSLWNKSNSVSSSHRNWGLFRSVNGVQSDNWGDDGFTNTSGTINTTSSGKNVDVVIVDGHFDPLHPEFAKNENGTGGTRVVQYNWFSLNPTVTGGTAGTYVYTPYVDSFDVDLTLDNDHGAHVASTAVGNTCGWARDAIIYNISPYSSNPNVISSGFILDYIKAFHNTKPINPVTGRRNPTITNHSYGVAGSVSKSSIASIYFRGSVYSGPFTDSEIRNYGLYLDSFTSTVTFPIRSPAFEADLTDLMDQGVIVVAAAGNEYAKIESPSTDLNSDYYNYVTLTSGFSYYYNRGTITSTPGIICVGAVSASVNESKNISSNTGPRIDLYAPGRYIMGAVNSTLSLTVNDSRNSSYKLTKKTGTSMASPQVAGVLACLAEQWPRMKQTDALQYITSKATVDQMYDSDSTLLSDYTSLQGSENRYLCYVKERPEEGQVLPRFKEGNRATSGMIFPRPKIYRYGR